MKPKKQVKTLRKRKSIRENCKKNSGAYRISVALTRARSTRIWRCFRAT
jgi:hypothetical protein